MPPYSGLPYPPAPAYCFPVAEFSLYALLIVCIVYAWRQGAQHAGYLLGGLLFGLILEYVNVNANLGYTYGKFFIMFGTPPKDIPLCIGVGWGIIMYTARLFSDHFGLPLWAAAALDALLAINIDLSMDTVAYRLHMWHWDWTEKALPPLTAQWFGVPWGNFFGWLMVVFFYSSFSRLLERSIFKRKQLPVLKAVLVPLLAVLLSQVCLYTMLVPVGRGLFSLFGMTSMHRFAGFLVILFILAGYGIRNRRRQQTGLPLIAWMIPLWFHCFFFAWLFIGGFYRENMLMTAVSVLNFGLALCLHTAVLLRRKTKITAAAPAGVSSGF